MNEETPRRQEGTQSEPIETEQSIFDSTITMVQEIPEIKSGKRETKLDIEQSQIIDALRWGQFWRIFSGEDTRGLHSSLETKAERWLKHPSGWNQMDFTIAQNGRFEGGFALEAVNIGANLGVVHRRSGVLIIAHPIGNALAVQTIYLPEDNHYREPRFDMQNEYWQRQHAFMEGINRTGREFVDQLDQEPTINKLKLAKKLIEIAVNSQKPVLSSQPQV